MRLARELARRGCRLSLGARRPDSLPADLRAIASERVLAHRYEASDPAAGDAWVKATVERFGRIDVLVNNAGVTSFIPHNALDQVHDEDWDRILGVNLIGPFQMVRAAMPALTASGNGAIVNVASIAGLSATGSSIPYCASKAALLNMTVALARVCAPKVRVNAVAPGFIEGEWLKQGLGPAYEMVKKQCQDRSPLHKVCTPEDVAGAILSLITGSAMITGQTIVVDGGMLIGSTP